MGINHGALLSKDWAQSKRVCSNCVGDRDIKNKIMELKYFGECDYCDSYNCRVIPVQLLSAWVFEVFSRDYIPRASNDVFARPHCEWDGETAINLFREIVGGRSDFLEELHYDFQDLCREKYSDIGMYSGEALYLPSAPVRLIHEWDELCKKLAHKTRFINVDIKRFLDSVFGNLERLDSNSGRLIAVFSRQDDVIYRGRVAKNDSHIIDMLNNPEKELGPPPSHMARAGRLNPVGIPVFYGALDKVTCLAEIRCPVGSKALVGGFKPVRDLRFLDLTVFDSVFADVGHFNHEYAFLSSAAEFLRELSDRFSQPVLPHEEELSYLPTQILFEYISCLDSLEIDGVIFYSTQTGREGKNVVLFNRNSGIKLSSTKYSLRTEGEHGFLCGNSYSFEPVDQVEIIEGRETSGDEVEEVLLFDHKSVSIYEISGVSYQFISQDVRR